MKKLRQLIILFCFLNTQVFAADVEVLKVLFKETWKTNYHRCRCGLNIRNFLEMAQEHNLSLENTFVVKIENLGFPGVVRAKNYRAKSRDTENFEFHVMLLADGHVFDYDYGNEPTVEALDVYLETMFAKPIKDYSFRLYDAQNYLDLTPNEAHQRSALKYLKDFAPGLVESLPANLP